MRFLLLAIVLTFPVVDLYVTAEVRALERRADLDMAYGSADGRFVGAR